MNYSFKIYLSILAQTLVICCRAQQTPASSPFPGVSRDLASFCAARPSLPIDLVSMVVHVKRNVSFNYKLYLFSNEYVFQTGQVVPRDDFRIHAFPVKLKRVADFWPISVPTYQLDGATQTQVASHKFDLNYFLRPVQAEPKHRSSTREKTVNKRHQSSTFAHHRLPEDARGESLPGDPEPHIPSFHGDHKNINEHIKFDRDDQVSALSKRSYHQADAGTSAETRANVKLVGDLVVPVGSFSSFHVNLTYMVRKDFGQILPEIIRVQIDPVQFSVNQLLLISNGSTQVPANEDYNFLNHKILRDTNTRITAINQIYEDWITRNFYTVVYIQRRQMIDSDLHDSDTPDLQEPKNGLEESVINDRLVFRGSSAALLGADQLDYGVSAAAFITEKNGLHYYLEFLSSGKFYLGAVDWTKRPFKIIDSQRYPIKATRTLLDNEEMLLCPPAVCYSDRPIDEVVAYGRIAIEDQFVSRVMAMFTSNSNDNHNRTKLDPTKPIHLNESALSYPKSTISIDAASKIRERELVSSNSDGLNNLDQLIHLTTTGSGTVHVITKLHLRDWLWPLARERLQPGHVPKFSWRYEHAKRNDIKAKQDTYGFALTGHDIEASYRVFNELFLISSNQLITINYTLANETVTSSHPLAEEFTGLASSILDPITAAYHDRYSNQIFFFKGDRYVGYDYASKKPLDEFLLGDGSSSLSPTDKLLISTLPVINLLGRQHYVDGIYHDLTSDLVFVFSGMKFYSFAASEFKNGLNRDPGQSLPALHCINEHFLSGCNFDRAYTNPCESVNDEPSAKLLKQPVIEITESPVDATTTLTSRALQAELDFNQRQQMKLRSIAANSGLLDLLVERTLLTGSNTAAPIAGGQLTSDNSKIQERTILYLLLATVALIIILALALVTLIYNWAKLKESQSVPAEASMGALTSRRSGNYMNNQHYSRSHIVRDRSNIKTVPGPVGVVISKGRTRLNNMTTTDSSAL